jgi:hypothetical protein
MEKLNVSELAEIELKSYNGGGPWTPLFVWLAIDTIQNWSSYKEAYREGYNHVRSQK